MESIAILVIGVAVLVVALVCLLLVLHPEYELGLFGVVGLGLLVIAALGKLDDYLSPGEVYHSPRVLIMWVGLAFFFGQLAWRFLKRCKLRSVYDNWRASGKKIEAR